MDREVTTHSNEETFTLGSDFSKSLQSGNVVCLYGELGSGKTTFVKGIAKGFGITNRILSPSFILVRQYQILNEKIKKESGINNLYHLDLYRLNSESEVRNIGIEEFLSDQGSVIVIEWSERGFGLLQKRNYDIHFELTDEFTRKITIQKI